MSGWRESDLGDIATLQRGFDLPARLRRRGSVPIVSSSGVSGWHDRAMVKAPGVVTGRYGTIGEVFFETSDFWPLNTTLWVSDFHGNDERFVFYLLSRVDYATHSGKSGVPGVNRNDLHRELVSLPGLLAEQRCIAEALTDADNLVAGIERLIAKKQAIKQGMMQQLLTGRTRLHGFAGQWREPALGEVAQFNKGMGLPKSAIDPNGSLLCIHYGELFTHYGPEIRSVTSRTTETALRVRSISNDVLMPTSDVTPRGLAKASAVMVDGVALGGDILVIRSNRREVFGPFLAYAIRLDANQVLQLVRGSTVYHLYAADMKSFRLKLPPLDEQRAICEVLRDASSEIDSLSARLAKARAIKTGMMQQLLTGRVRLPVEAAS